MSIQLILGGSGSGKSHLIYNRIIKDSMDNPSENYIVIVPEQYTMETQKKLVSMHPRKGILNIDVVSFERLAYKVFEEIGGGDMPVLDDTGKNLIIRKVMEDKKKELKIFSNSINKVGFISEMKSIISELLQYGIGTDELERIHNRVSDNQLLDGKIEDIATVFIAFKEYTQNHYITAEEILDYLCKVIDQSDIITNSTIVLDGFTGFTPIQYRVLSLLFIHSQKVYITVTVDGNERMNVHEGMQNMFFLSKDTIAKLIQIADDTQTKIEEHIILRDETNVRFREALDIAFLEKNVFRYNGRQYKGEVHSITLFEGNSPKEEIQFVIGKMLVLTREYGYRYRDMAIVAGDIATYGNIAANMLEQNGIPCFIDNKRSITGNPFVELLSGALEIIQTGYSYESIFRYLKTGMTDLLQSDIDILENYCLAMGIRGSKRWSEQWTRNYRGSDKADLDVINRIRARITEPLRSLEEALKKEEATVTDYVTALYQFAVTMNMQDKLQKLAEEFETSGDKSRYGEFRQIYKKVIELFDKLVELLGKEVLRIKEFSGILAAGFEEIKVGLIPPSVDSVVVGDIERTRLDNIKILFFVGVNDGMVPKKNENRGILSETDRDGLERIDVKLSQSSREKAFTQRFYLYLNMTKPSNALYISYAKKGLDGKSVMPSYLIKNMKRMFPQIKLMDAEFAKRELGFVRIPKSELIWSDENYFKSISEAAAMAVYGEELYGSVTRIEAFASCELAHFLDYGLGLKEREEYTLAVRDVGTILHRVLETISVSLKKDNKRFNTISEAERKQLVQEVVLDVTSDYGNTILKDSKRNEYMVNRLTNLADRTIWALGKQLDCGEFVPDAFEVPFILEAEELPNGARVALHGKIDRIDICEDDHNVYVKVIDYKSGNSDFDLLKTYYGIRLQLMAYMKAATEIEQKRHPDKHIVPAGVLYYNMSDPIVDKQQEEEEVTQQRILEQLRTKGLINNDRNIAKKFDSSDGKSSVVPVKYTKEGEVESSRNTISTEQFNVLDTFVMDKCNEMAGQIVKGEIKANPYRSGQSDSCAYCSYRAVCGFSEDMPGMQYRNLKKFSDEELWKKIREGGDTDGKDLDE